MKGYLRKGIAFVFIFGFVFVAGWGFGLTQSSSPWQLIVNGRPSNLHIHIIKNMYFISLSDLAQLPGWKVSIDLSSRKVSLRSPAGAMTEQANNQEAVNQPSTASSTPTSPDSSMSEASTKLGPDTTSGEGNGTNSGPPNNVRLTVQAALSSIDELRKALADDLPPDVIKQKRDSTAGIVQQAENLLWSLPRTRTLQADLQVAVEDLQSQINVVLALDQVKDGLLPWTHPVAQGVLMKYPDLRPCHVQKGKADGLDVACARKVLTDLSKEDFNDVQRDLDQYR